jgi:tetratricopeptide (TPR) repeat protein
MSGVALAPHANNKHTGGKFQIGIRPADMKLGSKCKWFLLPLGVALAVCAAYSNHFHNAFHFDDSHTIVQNPYIRDLRNLPRFFTDANTFSVLPPNRTYRPVVSASLAFDYALGRGYNVFWFHLSTFLLFLLQLAAMDALYRCILDATTPRAASTARNHYVSLLAVAWYGLHPAIAETVNYIIQRGDIYSTLGVVGGMAVYARMRRWRKTGLYLLPLAFGLLSKPPAAVFPLLLFLYIVLFERGEEPNYKQAVLATLPSLALSGALLTLQSVMTPKTFVPSTVSELSYLGTQPWVLLRYFGSFFLPLHLNVDTDLRPFTSVNAPALAGFAFLVCVATTAWVTARRRRLRPIAYGLLWFLIGSLPTSLYRLAETENDHRMYLPFVGLVLAVVWSAWLAVECVGLHRPAALRWSAAAACIVLAIYGYGAHVRNRVWRSEESLWLDDVEKCPHNGRGLMNYGLTQLSRGRSQSALDSFERALRYTPNYAALELNLGIANGALHRTPQAEAHFQRALLLAPADDQTHFFYGRWLYQIGRLAESVSQLERAVRLNPERLESRDQLALAYMQAGDDWINASLYQYQNRNYPACIADARLALKLKPGSALAYNNIGAAYAALGQWDLAIANEQQSLRIQPDFAVARNNLAWALSEKAGENSVSRH